MKAEFNAIAKEIITNKEYKKLIYENHHGLTRYEHSIRVAKNTYLITKKLGFDYVSATRAALLHDFFTDAEYEDITGFKKYHVHPILALMNAKAYFNLNAKEEDAIRTHMFPATLKLPASKEGLILNLADTGVAIYECGVYKLGMVISVWLLFIFNMITLSNN